MSTDIDYAIKPEKVTPPLDTSKWPLLLKNWGDLIVRTGHFTPIPNGCSPHKRDIKSYVSSGVINLVSPRHGFPPNQHTRSICWRDATRRCHDGCAPVDLSGRHAPVEDKELGVETEREKLRGRRGCRVSLMRCEQRPNMGTAQLLTAPTGQAFQPLLSRSRRLDQAHAPVCLRRTHPAIAPPRPSRQSLIRLDLAVLRRLATPVPSIPRSLAA